MKREIYLDNSATTKVLPEVVETAQEMMTKTYGNPSSLHKMGLAAEQIVRQSRLTVAGIIGARPEEIFFCSGALKPITGPFKASSGRAGPNPCI